MKVQARPPRDKRPWISWQTAQSGPMVWSGQVRSGQVRSECLTCTFRACLSRAQVLAFAGSSVREREEKKGGRGGLSALADTREYKQSDRNR